LDCTSVAPVLTEVFHTGTRSIAASAKLPPHALHLSTYAELESYVRAFAAGRLHLLMLIDPPGVGKSRHVRQALDQRVGWICCQTTSLVYLEALGGRYDQASWCCSNARRSATATSAAVSIRISSAPAAGSCRPSSCTNVAASAAVYATLRANSSACWAAS